LRRVDHRANAREYRTAEECRLVERQFRVDLDHRAPGYRGIFGEHRAAEVVIDGLPIASEAPSAGEQCSGAVGGGAGLAQRRAALGTRAAVPATWYEHQHDMIAAFEIGDTIAELFYYPSRFMSQRHRHRPRPVAVDDRQIGVTQAGRPDSDQYFARTGCCQFQFFNGQRLRCDVRRLGADGVQDGGSDLHSCAPMSKICRFPGRRIRSLSTDARRKLQAYAGDCISFRRCVSFMFSE
jgi:hypothetical protein